MRDFEGLVIQTNRRELSGRQPIIDKNDFHKLLVLKDDNVLSDHTSDTSTTQEDDSSDWGYPSSVNAVHSKFEGRVISSPPNTKGHHVRFSFVEIREFCDIVTDEKCERVSSPSREVDVETFEANRRQVVPVKRNRSSRNSSITLIQECAITFNECIWEALPGLFGYEQDGIEFDDYQSSCGWFLCLFDAEEATSSRARSRYGNPPQQQKMSSSSRRKRRRRKEIKIVLAREKARHLLAAL
jgi:hypothetical protein